MLDREVRQHTAPNMLNIRITAPAAGLLTIVHSAAHMVDRGFALYDLRARRH
jgi:hypothetical protein